MFELVTSIPKESLKWYVVNQLNTFFPDGNEVNAECEAITDAFEDALNRVSYCFNNILLKVCSDSFMCCLGIVLS